MSQTVSLKLSRNFTRTKTQVYSEQFGEISGTLSGRRVVLQQHPYRFISSTLPCAVCSSSSLKLPVKLKVLVLVLRGFYRSLAPVESHDSVTGTKLQLMRFFLDLFCRVKINAVHRSVKMQPLWSSALYINATFCVTIYSPVRRTNQERGYALIPKELVEEFAIWFGN